MTHAVIIESNSRTGMLALETAQQLGWETTFLWSRRLRPLYRGGRTDEIMAKADRAFELASSFDVDELTARLSSLHAEHPVDALLTCVEYCTVPLAAAAERLGLRYTSRRAVESARSKHVCRRMLERNGIPSARYGAGETPEALLAIAQSIGFPLIAKPVSGWGSLLTAHVKSDEELRRYHSEYQNRLTGLRSELQGTLRGAILLEEFLCGRVFSVEMGANDGVIIPFMISEGKRSMTHPTVPLGTTMPADLTATEEKAILDYVAAVMTVLGFDIGICHIELALTADGPRLIEFNPRVMGSSLPLIYKNCTGRNIYEFLLRIHAGETIAPLDRCFIRSVTSRTIASWDDGRIRTDLPADWLNAIRNDVVSYQIDVTPGQKFGGLKNNFFDALGFIQVAAETPAGSAALGDAVAAKTADLLGFQPCR